MLMWMIIYIYIYMNVDNGHDYVLMLIMVMLVNNHDDACWIIMTTMLVNYICICSYMLLVNFLTCYWWRFDCVSMYWNMLVLIVEVVWTYALLLLSHMFMYSYPYCWRRILCIQLLVTTNTLYSIIGDDYDVFVASWGDNLGVDLVPHASRGV